MNDRDLSEYSIEEKDVNTGEIREFNPSASQIIHRKHNNREESENAATALYSEVLGYHVGNVDHKLGEGLNEVIEGMPDAVKNHLQNEVLQNTSLKEKEGALEMLDREGIPDLFMCKKTDVSDFQLVEVKMESEDVREPQRKWFDEFGFLPVKVARVYRDFEPQPASPNSLAEPDIDGDSLPEVFEAWRRYYSRTRPKTGSRSQNDGMASLVTLVHYGLLDATGYDTGVVRSLSSEVLAASLAALRGEDRGRVHHYLGQDHDREVLKEMLEEGFRDRFGTAENPYPLEIRDSVGGIGAEICAILRVLDRSDPLEATKRNLDGETK